MQNRRDISLEGSYNAEKLDEADLHLVIISC